MTITKEGVLASFYTVNKEHIKHLKVYFSPKQAGEGTPSPENVREISGWNEINMSISGNSLCSFTTDIDNYYGWEINEGLKKYKNLRYSMYVDNTNGTAEACMRLMFRDKNGTTILRKARTNGTLIGNKAREYIGIGEIPPEATMAYFGTSGQNVIKTEPMITIDGGGTINFEKYEPYHGQTHIINWIEEVGTVYGGYVDLVTGELVENETVVTITSADDFIKQSRRESAGGIYFMKERITPNCLSMQESNAIQVEKYSHGTIANPWAHNKNAAYAFSTNSGCTIRLGFADDMNITELTDLDTWIKAQGGVSICYPLATPIIHTLSSTQLSTLIGRNNIWSNADRVEVEYDLAESNDELYRRRNILMRSAPHIETASGNMAHFETDLVAPLKSAKISFSPVQEGSGDPSPENVRAISGCSGIELTHCQDNLFDMNSLQISNGTYSISVENGVATGSGTAFYILMIQNKNIIKKPFIALKGYSYTFSITAYTDGNVSAANENGLAFVVFYSDGTNYVRARWKNNETTPSTKTYTVNADSEVTGIAFSYSNAGSNIWHITSIKVKIGASTSIEPYSGTIIPIDWSSTVGTIYGGYINLITGELVKTHDLCIMDGVTSQKMFTAKGGVSSSNPWSNNYYFQFEAASLLDRGVGWIPADVLSSNSIFSNYFPNHDGNGITITDISFGAYIGSNGTRFQPRIMWPYSTTEFDTIEKANNWLKEQYNNGTPFSFTYKLRTPVSYQLSSQTLRTLRGTNNIWTNANGPVEIKYWTH